MPSTGQTLYRRARKIMPGGTQLLSKRPEMFLPEQWPFNDRSRCALDGAVQNGDSASV
jgi:hypothetical protein